MSKLEEARKVWIGKSDEWLYERLANELTSKVEEIHHLLKEISEVKEKSCHGSDNYCVDSIKLNIKCDNCKSYY